MERDLVKKLMTVVIALVLSITAIQLPRIITLYEIFAIEPSIQTEATIVGSSEVGSSGDAAQVYLLEPPAEDELGNAIFSNLTYALDYGRISYQPVEAESIGNMPVDTFKTLVLIGERLEGVDLPVLNEFTQAGGNLYVANRLNRPDLDVFFGLEENLGFLEKAEFGLEFAAPIFPGYENIPADSNLFAHSVLDAVVVDEAQLLLKTIDVPVMWKMNRNAGNVLYSNTTMFADKYTRGLFLQTLSMLPPAFWVSQSGIYTFHIDDFPAPIPNDTISAELSGTETMPIQQFYQETWWPDMEQLAEQYQLIYSGFMIGTYEDEALLETAELIELEQLSMTYFGRQLLLDGGEIGLHGYNHQSLVTADEPIDPALGYKPWASQEEMEGALQKADETFKQFYPNYEINSYVPPSNILNRTGIRALAATFPNLTNVASLYLGQKGQGDLIQEFEPDEEFPSIYHFPRVSSGYLETPDDRFMLVDAIANMGIFSHFVHPDDVLDDFRNRNRNWATMKEDLSAMLTQMTSNYPHHMSLKQREAVEYWKLYEKSSVELQVENQQIKLTAHLVPNQALGYLRINDPELVIETGQFEFGEVIESPVVDNLYFVKLTQEESVLE